MDVLNLNLNSFEMMCKKKCAEVFYQNIESFSIVCTVCNFMFELKTMKFEDFIKHFKDTHVFQEQEMFETTTVTIKKEKDTEDSCNSTNEEPIDPIQLTQAQLLEVDEDIKCENESVDNDNRLELSTESEEDNVPLKILGEKTTRKKRLRRAQTDNNNTCTECGRVYKSRKALSRHTRSKHAKNPTYPETFQCSSCDKTYYTKSSLQAHERMKHRGEDGSQPGIYPCTKCDKTYSDKYSLKDHLLRHLGQRNFHCEVPGCSRTFFNRKNLNFHVRIIHMGEKNFVCEVCGHSTKTAASLVMHKRTHTGEKPFNCTTCGKAFATQSGVREHMVTHAVNERPHVCNICGKTFARPKALYHHKPLHSDVKKFVCKICGKAYAQQAGLSAHKRQHLLNNFKNET